MFPRRWLLAAGVSLAPRLALGFERLSSPGDLEVHTAAICCSQTFTEHETLLAAMLHFAIVRRPSISLEVVGGVGGVRVTGTRTTIVQLHQDNVSESATVRVLIVGGEAAVRVVAHVFVVPMLRIYDIDRQPLAIWKDDSRAAPQKSTAVLVGVAGRLAW